MNYVFFKLDTSVSQSDIYQSELHTIFDRCANWKRAVIKKRKSAAMIREKNKKKKQIVKK